MFFICMMMFGMLAVSTAQTNEVLLPNVSVKLVLKNSPKQILYLRTIDSRMTYEFIDSTLIGSTQTADTLHYNLYVSPSEEKHLQLGFSKKRLNFIPLLQAGDHLQIEADFNKPDEVVYSGSAHTKEYRDFNKMLIAIGGDSLLTYRMAVKAHHANSAILMHKIDSIQKLQGAFIRKTLSNTNSPYVAVMALLGGQNGVAGFTGDEYALMRNKFKNSKHVLLQIDINERVQEHPVGIKPKPANGTYLADFTLPDINGKLISLAQLKGKYVLVDFWASWCSPCRKESPYLKQAMQKFKKGAFIILAVSIDENQEAWKTAIEMDGTQEFVHLIDTRGNKSPITKQYNIESIPASFLLDPTGKIIDRDLRGVKLISKLEELLIAK